MLNFNEIHQFDDLIRLTPLSSGLHFGSCNWLIEVGSSLKIGILNKSSHESEYRYPLTLNIEQLIDVDVLLVGSVIN
jgi:hypothetical protein